MNIIFTPEFTSASASTSTMQTIYLAIVEFLFLKKEKEKIESGRILDWKSTGLCPKCCTVSKAAKFHLARVTRFYQTACLETSFTVISLLCFALPLLLLFPF